MTSLTPTILTAHAAQRLISRGITGDELREVLTNPTITRPGKEEGTQIRMAGDVRIVVAGCRILTIARRDCDFY